MPLNTRHLRSVLSKLALWSAAGCLLLAWGCSSGGVSLAGRPAPGQGRARQNLTSSSPAPSAITIASLPNAKCVLHHGAHAMPVWADDVGLVHLWAPQTSMPDSYMLECDEAGSTVQYSYDLSDPATFVPATPRAPRVGWTTRPALTDPMAPTQAELAQSGYPPRPDPVRAPSMYKQWLSLVSAPAQIPPTYLVDRPDLRFDPASPSLDTRWCGLALNQSSTRYVSVTGSFVVPIFCRPPGQRLFSG